jgi:hypothetical protein
VCWQKSRPIVRTDAKVWRGGDENAPDGRRAAEIDLLEGDPAPFEECP